MKLVRDHIPAIIMGSGGNCEYFRVTSEAQHMAFLKEKMLEELDEFMADPCTEEAGDMLEVLLAMLHLKGISFEDVQDTSYVKKLERGGFEEGVVLVKW